MEQDPGGAEHWGRRALDIAIRAGEADAIDCHRLAIERNVPDLAARIALYLGWLVATQSGIDYGLVTAGPKGIAGGIGRREDGGPGHVTVYVEVDHFSLALSAA